LVKAAVKVTSNGRAFLFTSHEAGKSFGGEAANEEMKIDFTRGREAAKEFLALEQLRALRAFA
jgi:hypothetical protein